MAVSYTQWVAPCTGGGELPPHYGRVTSAICAGIYAPVRRTTAGIFLRYRENRLKACGLNASIGHAYLRHLFVSRNTEVSKEVNKSRNSSLKRSAMAHVNDGSHSFTCHPNVYP